MCRNKATSIILTGCSTNNMAVFLVHAYSFGTRGAGFGFGE
jgi:hypothetical protein